MTRTSKRIKNVTRIATGLLFGILVFGGVAVMSSTAVYAAAAADGTVPKDNICPKGTVPTLQKVCVNDPNELQSTPDASAKTCSGNDCSGLIVHYINPLIKLLAGLVGILVVIGVIVGGIQISSAGGDPGKVIAGRKRITNAIIALIAYLFMFAFLQWLLPGGIV